MPYSRFSYEELILRDHLAVDRTILANERTLLSYVRTAIMLLVTGVTLIKFFPTQMTVYILGYLFLPLAFGVGIFGIARYRLIARRIRHVTPAKCTEDQ